jgi:hypothetical protein
MRWIEWNTEKIQMQPRLDLRVFFGYNASETFVAIRRLMY